MIGAGDVGPELDAELDRARSPASSGAGRAVKSKSVSCGVTAADAADARLVPALLVAVTVKV